MMKASTMSRIGTQELSNSTVRLLDTFGATEMEVSVRQLGTALYKNFVY